MKLKNKLILLLLVMCFMIPGVILLSSCDINIHVHALTKIDAKSATCVEDGNTEYYACECGKFFSDELGTTEIAENFWVINAYGHLYDDNCDESCNTCAALRVAPHTYSADCDATCNDCEHVRETVGTHSHSYSSNWDGTHQHECSKCGEVFDAEEACSGGTATCTQKAVCEHCGYQYGSVLGHNYSGAWNKNTTHHWHNCTRCGLQSDYEAHTWDTQVVVAPTIENVWGYTEYTCKCGATKKDNYTCLLTFSHCCYAEGANPPDIPSIIVSRNATFTGTTNYENNYYKIIGYSDPSSTIRLGGPILYSTNITVTWNYLNEYHSVGVGSENNPYLIYNELQLQDMATFYNASGSIAFYFKQMANIDLSSIASWTPIGHNSTNTTRVFSGVYDGNDYVIDNMTIDTSSNYFSAGLFGTINGTSTLRNINMTNVNIARVGWFKSEGDISYGCTIGSIVGYASSGATVTNCTASGSITADGKGNDFVVGGIIGYGQATKCVNYCDITISSIGQDIHIGGISGMGGAYMCKNAGDISVTQVQTYTTSNLYIGGITNGYTENSYAICNISFTYTGTTGYEYFNPTIGGISSNSVDSKNSYYYGHIYYSSTVEFSRANVGYLNAYNSLGEESENVYYCTTLAGQNYPGYKYISLPEDDLTNHITGLTSVEMTSGKIYFIGFGEYVSDADLLLNPNNVWVFTNGRLPKLYFEV